MLSVENIDRGNKSVHASSHVQGKFAGVDVWSGVYLSGDFIFLNM